MDALERSAIQASFSAPKKADLSTFPDVSETLAKVVGILAADGTVPLTDANTVESTNAYQHLAYTNLLAEIASGSLSMKTPGLSDTQKTALLRARYDGLLAANNGVAWQAIQALTHGSFGDVDPAESVVAAFVASKGVASMVTNFEPPEHSNSIPVQSPALVEDAPVPVVSPIVPEVHPIDVADVGQIAFVSGLPTGTIVTKTNAGVTIAIPGHAESKGARFKEALENLETKTKHMLAAIGDETKALFKKL